MRVSFVAIAWLLTGCAGTWSAQPAPAPRTTMEREEHALVRVLELRLARLERDLDRAALATDEQGERRYRDLALRRLRVVVALAELRARLEAGAATGDVDALLRDAELRLELARARPAHGGDDEAERDGDVFADGYGRPGGGFVLRAAKHGGAAPPAEPDVPAAEAPSPLPLDAPGQALGEEERGIGRIAKDRRKREIEEQIEEDKGAQGAAPMAATVVVTAPPADLLPEVRKHVDDLARCLPAALRRDGVALEITARLTSQGDLRSVRVVADAELPLAVEDCLVLLFESIHVPPPAGGGSHLVRFNLAVGG